MQLKREREQGQKEKASSRCRVSSGATKLKVTDKMTKITTLTRCPPRRGPYATHKPLRCSTPYVMYICCCVSIHSFIRSFFHSFIGSLVHWFIIGGLLPLTGAHTHTCRLLCHRHMPIVTLPHSFSNFQLPYTNAAKWPKYISIMLP